MLMPPEQRKGEDSRSKRSIITILAVLLFLLIAGAAGIVLENLHLIPSIANVKIVLIAVVILDLGIMIVVGGLWFYTSISAGQKVVQDRLPEQNVQPAASILLPVSPDPPDLSGLPIVENGKSATVEIAAQDNLEQIDIREAPHVEYFYGRVDELATIKRWIVDEQCRLVSIIGVGGIGKTTLITKLINQEQHAFHAVFWRRLLNAPPFEQILQDCLQFLTRGQQIAIPQDIDEQMQLLVKQLQQKRCLIVLDNAEAILKSGSSTAEYKDGYEQYGNLIMLLGKSEHQSCVLVTSRVQLKEVSWLEDEGASVHTYRLEGLNLDDALLILERKATLGEEHSLKALVEYFAGNPLALMVALSAIRETYHGNIPEYLIKFDNVLRNDLRALMDSEFEHLPQLEQQAFYWLAIEREAVSFQDLLDTSIQSVSKGRMLEALEVLQRRSLAEKNVEGNFTLQPAMMEVVTDRFNELVVQEIVSDRPELFASHALFKAQAKAYVRESQFQLLLNVIAQKLFAMLGRRKLEEKFRQRLAALRGLPEPPDNYEAGNILNLLVQTGYDLRGYDFSRLVVRQAYLQEVELPEVNFAYANLATSVFTDTFGNILSVALSPQGDLLAAGTAAGEIRLWHAANGLLLQTFRGHTDWIRSVAFSPDGKTLASGSDDQTVRLWEVSSGKLLTALQGHSHWIWSVAFSPDGKILVSGSGDQTVRLWEVSSGKLLSILQDHTDWVRSVAFSPDGKTLASGSSDQTVCLWEVSSGKLLTSLHGHSHWVRSVAFSPDGKTLASGSEDRTVHLWEVSSGKLLSTLHGHTNAIWSVAFSPDGSTLASGSDDQTVRLWEVSSGKLLSTLHGHTNAIWSVAFSPDGRTLASGSDDQTVRLWEVSSGKLLTTLQGHNRWIRSVAFSPDGKTLASGSEDRTVRLWEVSSGKLLSTLHGHTNEICSVAFSPDGSTLASGSNDQTVCLWEVSSGKLLSTLHGHTNAVRSVAFSPDGKTLVSGSYEQTVCLWEVSSGKLLSTLHGHTNEICSVAFSPDGSTFASGSNDQTVCLWEVSNGKLLSTLHGHTNAVRSVAFSPDGETLISGSNDQTVCLWEVSSGKLLSTLHGHSRGVWSVAFNPDGRTLASCSYDGTIKLWDRQTGACLYTLRSNRPYEHMNIIQATGLTEMQRASLKLLGTVEE